jgi:hypothetical protein
VPYIFDQPLFVLHFVVPAVVMVTFHVVMMRLSIYCGKAKYRYHYNGQYF